MPADSVSMSDTPCATAQNNLVDDEEGCGDGRAPLELVAEDEAGCQTEAGWLRNLSG